MHRFNKCPRSLTRPKDKYQYIFATRDEHAGINTIAELKAAGTWNASLGLFWNGIAIGTGELYKENWQKKYLHTDAVRLARKYRNKGHGIALYAALILCAKKLGAKRIYSSKNLNKFSGRMWREKLGKVGYPVKKIKAGCNKPCRHCNHHPQYYIEL